MRHIANRLAHKLTAQKDLYKPEERYRIGLIESWVSIVGNILLTALKVIFGLLTNSIALIADAAHSASDILSSLVVLIGFFLAKKKPDQEHPHGHGRAEYLAGLIIAVMLIGAGIAFAYSSYTRLIGGIFANPSIASIILILFAILIKEFMYFFSVKLGALINSEALTADAWHHRSDSFSSVLVLVALVGGFLGMPALDAYFGFAISLFIVYTGIKIAGKSCSLLLGSAPVEELKNGITSCVKEFEGVIDIHDLEIHDYGSWKVVTMHIGVNGRQSLNEAHEIANQIEDCVSTRFHCNTTVHLDPQ